MQLVVRAGMLQGITTGVPVEATGRWESAVPTASTRFIVRRLAIIKRRALRQGRGGNRFRRLLSAHVVPRGGLGAMAACPQGSAFGAQRGRHGSGVGSAAASRGCRHWPYPCHSASVAPRMVPAGSSNMAVMHSSCEGRPSL